ncbi:MAG: DedA family protein [Acidobacteriota bacterium]
MDIETVIKFLVSSQPHWVVVILFFSAIVEYIFPPFPGDTVTLAGAILIGSYGYNFFIVFFAVTAGSFLGSMLDFYIGNVLKNKKETWLLKFKRSNNIHDKINSSLKMFEKWGIFAILLNRFMPGIRAFIFIAAGMSNIKVTWVSLSSLISITVWNTLIIFAGIILSKNFYLLVKIIKNFHLFIWTIIIILIFYLLLRYFLKKYKKVK